MLSSDIFGFAEVFFEVVEFDAKIVVELNKLPIAGDDGGAGRAALVAIVGVMPEKGIAMQGRGGAFKKRQERQSVEGGVRKGPPSGGDEGGIKVGGGNGSGAGGAGFDVGGPADEEGDARAAFVHPAFTIARWGVAGGRVLGGGEAAVIGGKDDKRVVGDAGVVDRFQQSADIGVKVLNHGGVDGIGLDGAENHVLVAFVDDGEEVALDEILGVVEAEVMGFFGIFFDERLGGLEWGVDGVVAEVHEERLVRIALLNKRDCLGSEAIREIFAFRAIRKTRVVVWGEIR